ncbi:signal transduction histidine kinase [Nocardiopsis arvandica]|uniref:Signal transduction histidine kinase n=1 Tax=Nocardiopsis sinuspersici TaxID=501010 RepID=A0A7Y9X9E8_9ACTN|nr:hypothetical protein [Nocardiopsis sinuspersici]NYH51473.1 signal transduction histidine kinase [Nocardiopsis sinuspersici]
MLAEEGLRAALHGLVGRSDLPIDLGYDLSRTLSPTVETAAYSVVAEAVTNAVKHSGAERIGSRAAAARTRWGA